jgi:hypothetical protein
VSPIDDASINELEKYGFYINDKEATIAMLFANKKNLLPQLFIKGVLKTFS